MTYSQWHFVLTMCFCGLVAFAVGMTSMTYSQWHFVLTMCFCGLVAFAVGMTMILTLGDTFISGVVTAIWFYYARDGLKED